MAITITWGTKVINVPKADTLLIQSVPTEIRQLDLDAFRLTLKDLEDSEDGIVFLDTHSHNPPVTVGGVTLARVVEIINGYTVTFEDGQYAVNLVGANSNVADVTNVNQVSIRSANSAGLTFSDQILDQSFTDNAVYIDIDNGMTGTSFPRGSSTDPVDNYSDANIIALSRNFRKYDVFGVLTLGGGDDIEAVHFIGHTGLNTEVIAASNVSTGTIFEDLKLSGTLNGRSTYVHCLLSSVLGFCGESKECNLEGTLVLKSSVTTNVTLIDCTSATPGSSRPIFDCNGATADIQFRNYTGGLKITNNTASNNISIDVLSGTIELDSTCTAGTIVIRGVVQLIDNSGVGCTVVTDGTVTSLSPSGDGLTKSQFLALK